MLLGCPVNRGSKFQNLLCARHSRFMYIPFTVETQLPHRCYTRQTSKMRFLWTSYSLSS